jgi:site-specific recombinase XerD
MSGRFYLVKWPDIAAEGMMNFVAYLVEKGITGNTFNLYSYALKLAIAEIKDLEHLTPIAFKAWLDGHIAWGSSAKYVAYNALKGFIAWQYGQNHPALALKVKKKEAGPQRVLNMQQVQALLAIFDTMTPKGIRDLAICTLMLDSGLRVSEVCHLEVKNLNIQERHLSVIIKGGRWGEGVFSMETARYLENWIVLRKDLAVSGIKTVFVGIGGNTPGQPLTREGMRAITRDWGKKAGIGELSPHDFRRTFAVLATRLHAPARTLQVAGRWKSMSMVEHYTAAINAEDFEDFFPVSGAMRS